MNIQKIEGATWRQRPKAAAEGHVPILAEGAVWTLNLINNNNNNYILFVGTRQQKAKKKVLQVKTTTLK
jgi:hypothetical protein